MEEIVDDRNYFFWAVVRDGDAQTKPWCLTHTIARTKQEALSIFLDAVYGADATHENRTRLWGKQRQEGLRLARIVFSWRAAQ